MAGTPTRTVRRRTSQRSPNHASSPNSRHNGSDVVGGRPWSRARRRRNASSAPKRNGFTPEV